MIKRWVVDYDQPDGTIAPGLWQPTNDSIVGGQKFESPGDDREIERTVADTLAQYNMSPVSIEVLHPLDAAIKVVATIDSPDAMNGRLAELQPMSPAPVRGRVSRSSPARQQPDRDTGDLIQDGARLAVGTS